ncbi:MAG: hypothetical protein ACK4E7_02250 [Permianibacter sp.]
MKWLAVIWQWFNPRHWQRYAERMRRREQLALLLWPYLPEPQRTRDDMPALRLLNTMVRQLEAGNDDFSATPAAQMLWQQACTDNEVQQSCGALRTLYLQMQADASAAGLQVANLATSELRRLRKRMQADSMHSELNLVQQLPVLLPILSGLLLFSGWFFNVIFLGRLGVPVSHYFGLTDYLAASMEGLVPVLISIAVTVVVQWFSRARIRLQSLQRLLSSQWLMQLLMLVVFFAILLLMPVLLNAVQPEQITLIRLYVVAVMAMTVLLPWLAGFSQRPAHMYLLLNLVTLFLVVVWFMAETTYLRTQEVRPARTELRLAESPDEVRRWHILSGNSLYLFLHDEKKEVHVVPLEQVLSIRHLPAEKLKPEGAAETAPEPELEPAPERPPVASPAAEEGNKKAGQ